MSTSSIAFRYVAKSGRDGSALTPDRLVRYRNACGGAATTGRSTGGRARGHSQPFLKPARLSPLTMAGQAFINCQSSPDR